jgi:hypothetical protein
MVFFLTTFEKPLYVIAYYYYVFKMVSKNKKNENTEDVEDLEKPVDLERVRTSVIFDREKLSRLKVESAEKGISMGGLLRKLLDNHLGVVDESRELVEDNLDDILEGCGRFFGGFKLDTFLDKMSDTGIELSYLNSSEWRSVLGKLEEGGLNGAKTAGEYADKFDDLSPTVKQRKDLRSLARKLIKKQKEDIF